MHEVLLSIAIPTYNREKFLKRCLEYLYLQIADITNDVEIIVSDNASSDNTKNVVDQYIDLGLNIIYIRNSENRGPDFNIAQCYKTATGKYVLTLGDDDILIINSIKNIVSIIKENCNAGVIYLNNFEYKAEDETVTFKNNKIDYKVYKSQTSFIHYVTYFTTFISGNLVNKKALDHIDFDPWVGSCLIQLPLILTAIRIFPENIVIKTKLLGVQVENSGGYNIYNIFGKKLKDIADEIFHGKNNHYTKIITRDLSVRFFPYWVCRLKEKNNFEPNISSDEILKLIDDNIYTGIFIKPLLIMPKKLDKFYLLFIKTFGLLRRKLLLTYYNK